MISRLMDGSSHSEEILVWDLLKESIATISRLEDFVHLTKYILSKV